MVAYSIGSLSLIFLGRHALWILSLFTVVCKCFIFCASAFCFPSIIKQLVHNKQTINWINIKQNKMKISSMHSHLVTYVNNQLQQRVRVLWPCVSYGFCQSWLPWLVIAVKIVLKWLRVQVRQTDDCRASRWCHVTFSLKTDCLLQRAMSVGTILPYYGYLAPEVRLPCKR